VIVYLLESELASGDREREGKNDPEGKFRDAR
jgi:hypothetical protein